MKIGREVRKKGIICWLFYNKDFYIKTHDKGILCCLEYDHNI